MNGTMTSAAKPKKLYKTAKRKYTSNKDEGNLAKLRAMGNAYKSIIRTGKKTTQTENSRSNYSQ